MALHIYNTLTRKKEAFVPLQDDKVTMYVCGPTVYDYAHLGHARSSVAFDVIKRFLEYSGFTVFHVNNITDVDDKIITRSNESNITIAELSEKFTDFFYEDMNALGVAKANVCPRATAHIIEMITFVQNLIDKGHAYAADGSVYFDVTSFDNYGSLSKIKPDESLSETEKKAEAGKRNPRDFALWKTSKENEPFWPSPWGNGRPGWHIECSVMSSKYLGDQFDIHGGGVDLVFPHHENEIAQSEAFSGKSPFAKYWLHNGFVMVNKEKMSKSLGNFFTVRDILKDYAPSTVRFFLVSTHYRSPIDFSDSALKEAEKSFERILNARRQLGHAQEDAVETENWTDYDSATLQNTMDIKKGFIAAMEDDFNTAGAINKLFELSKISNNYVAEAKPLNQGVIIHLNQLFNELGGILNLFLSDTEESSSTVDKVDSVMQILIELRKQAREGKNWAMADEIRDKLSEANIILEDKPDKTVWKIKE